MKGRERGKEWKDEGNAKKFALPCGCGLHC